MNPSRHLRTFAAAVSALVVAAAVLAGLAAPFLFGATPPSTPPATPTLDSVLVNVSTDKTEYAAGEVVQITATVHNAGSASVTLLQFDSCGDRVRIADSNGTLVWEAKLGLACLQVISEYSLAPGASSVSHFEWSQTDFEGTPVPANRSYQVVYAVVEGHLGPIRDAVIIRADTWIFVRASA